MPAFLAKDVWAKRLLIRCIAMPLKSERAEDLLASCMTARQRGEDFPTIWSGMLRRHPLVLGLPIQVITKSEPILKIQLANGQSLCFQNGAFSLG